MKYVKTQLKDFDICQMLKQNRNYDSDNDLMRFIADDALIPRTFIYPHLYFFKDLDGKNLVLVTWHDVDANAQDFTVVFNVVEFDPIEDRPCETILRDLTNNIFHSDVLNVLPLYGLRVKPPLATENCKDVKIWVEYERDPDEFTSFTPFDSYYKNLDTDKIYIFKTYKDAQTWVSCQNTTKKTLVNGQTVIPHYHIVK